MMKFNVRNISRFLLFLFALLLLYIGLTKYFHIIKNLKSDLAVGIIAASTTIFISILSIVITKYYEKKLEITRELRNKKIPIYEEFIQYWFKILFSIKTQREAPSELDIIRFFVDSTEKIVIWGSDDVLNSFNTFRKELIKRELSTDEKERNEGLFFFEKLLKDIRKDLGHKNKNIDKGNILGLIVNDIDKYV